MVIKQIKRGKREQKSKLIFESFFKIKKEKEVRVFGRLQ